MNKRILPTLLAGIIIFTSISTLADSMTVPVKVKLKEDKVLEEENKVYKKLLSVSDLDLYEKDGIQMVPLRPIGEALGFKIDWDKSLRQVNVSKDALSVSLRSNENYYVIARKSPVKLSLAPEITNNKTYVPIEFFTEILHHQLLIAGDDLAILMEKKEDETDKKDYIDLEGYVKFINRVNDDISILVGVKEADIDLSEIYLHLVEDTKIMKGKEEAGIEDIKIGSKIKATMPELMTMSLPPQTTAKTVDIIDFIEIEKREKDGIKYPEIVKMEDEVVKSYFDQYISSFVEELEAEEIYKNLDMDYIITYLDNNKISIIFRGTYDFLNKERELIKTISIDLNTGKSLDFNNYFKSDDESRDKLEEILRKTAKNQYNKSFEAEGVGIYFTENQVVFYYYELDDDVSIPTELYVDNQELEDLINPDIIK